MRPPLALLTTLSLLAAIPARADGRIDYLARQLTKGADPRVRAQAALVLGATEDPAALGPLCGALADDSGLVRAAAARALGKLEEPEGSKCLARLKADPDPDARSAALGALRSLDALARRPARLYVALDEVRDGTGKLSGEQLKLVEARLKRRLVQQGALVAPTTEPRERVQKTLKARRLKGYQLKAELQPSGAGLSLVLVCLTYPENILLGQVQARAAGAPAAELVKALVPRVVADAADTFEWSH